MISYLLLKIIAIISMTLDHIYFSGISSNPLLTCIGRLAFPIYCYQLVEGFSRTSDLKKYKIRLLLFAIISEIPFDLLCHGNLFSLSSANVIFTLFLGLVCIESLDNYISERALCDESVWVKHILIIFICFIFSHMFNTDYSYWGLITIILFYYLRNKEYKYILFICWFFLFAYLSPQVVILNFIGEYLRVNRIFFTPLSVVIIYLVEKINESKNLTLLIKRFNKYLKLLFYFYYPLHMLVLYFMGG